MRPRILESATRCASIQFTYCVMSAVCSARNARRGLRPGRNAEGSLTTVGFGDVHATHRFGPVPSAVHAVAQVLQLLRQSLFVGRDRFPVDSRCRSSLQSTKRSSERWRSFRYSRMLRVCDVDLAPLHECRVPERGADGLAQGLRAIEDHRQAAIGAEATTLEIGRQARLARFDCVAKRLDESARPCGPSFPCVLCGLKNRMPHAAPAV